MIANYVIIGTLAFSAGLAVGWLVPRLRAGWHWAGYRAALQRAAAQGDVEFLRRERSRQQLTQQELANLARRQTPLDEWSGAADDLMDPADIGSAKRD